MPTIKDQVADVAQTIGMNDPAMLISKGIQTVGEKAEPYVNKGKALLQQGADYVKSKLATPPPPITTDIELPKEGKKKSKPITRSLSRR